MQLFERAERSGCGNLWMLPAVLELEHLHDELDIDQPAGPTFEIAARRLLFHAGAHLPDGLGIVSAPGAIECGLANHAACQLGRGFGSVHDSGLAECLPLPELR